MDHNKVENAKMFGTATTPPNEATPPVEAEEELTQDKIAPTVTMNGNYAEFKLSLFTTTLPPAVPKQTLATLNPGELELSLPGLEGSTMVVDVDAAKNQKCAKRLSPIRRSNTKQTPRSSSPMSSQSDRTEEANTPLVKSNGFSTHNPEAKTTVPKPSTVAPIANMGLAQSATERSVQQVQTTNTRKQMAPISAPASLMEGIQQSEPAITDEATIVPQPSLPQTMPAQGVAPTDRLSEHCAWISHGLREVLETEKLKVLARPDQRGLAQDLYSVFETTIRHLEGDIAWVFKKHGAGGGRIGGQ